MENKEELKNTNEVKESKTIKNIVPEMVEATETDKTSIQQETKKIEDAKPVTEEVPKVKTPVVEEEEDFNWDNTRGSGFGDSYSKSQKEEMEKMYESTLGKIVEKEVITGTVVSISARDIILNIGFKSDGLVSASEFKDIPDLKVGDEVKVFVEEQEDSNGQLVLSRKKAKIVDAWQRIQEALDNDKVIDGMVKRRTKGGLIVDIYGVEAFLPGSQIDVKPIRDFDIFVDKSMDVKVVKINYTNDNVVVSHKALIEKDLEKQRFEILNNLEKGQILEGVIKNMTSFGVFIDLGGVDGLLHITDISWGRVNHPEEVLKLDQKVNVVVLDFDDAKKRISLGMKQLTDHPWEALDKKLEIGFKVKGKIVNVTDYGAFLEIQPGVEGLIHVSEMSWSQHLRNPQDFMNIGDELEAVILTIDREERKMSLGIKQLSEDPWAKQDVLTKYAVGTTHIGTIRNLTNFGLFIELEEGIDGLVHVSDLSWTKKIKHPSEFVSVDEKLEVKVLELDVANRRLALGHKQLEENPWDTFGTVFTIGSKHKCSVISKNDKGAVLELPYGLEGFVLMKNLIKEDGSKIEVGENLDFVVTEFSKDDRKIILSHVSTYQNEKIVSVKKKNSGGRNISDNFNVGAEKLTLGDLDVLSTLKDQMESNSSLDKKSAAKKKIDSKLKKEEELKITEASLAEEKKVTKKVEKEEPTEEAKDDSKK